MKRIKNKKFVLFLFFLSIASAVVWAWPFSRPGDTSLDTAKAILENGLFSNHYLMEFMMDRISYPIFMAGVFKVFGQNLMIIRIIQVFIYAGLVLLIYKFCQDFFGERTAKLACFIAAVSYTLASFTGWLYREIIFTTLVFLLVYLLYQAQRREKNIWFVLAGLVFGLAVLTNSIIQFFLFIIIANFLFLNRGGIKKVIPQLALFFMAVLSIISPFIISNYLNFKVSPFPFGAREGLVIYMRVEKMKAIEGKYLSHFIGNATGDFIAQKLFDDYDPNEARLGWQNREEWKKMIYQEGRDVKEVDRELTEKSIREIFKHPVQFLKMSSIDFLKYNTPMVPDVRMQHMFAEPGSHPEFSDFTKIAIILSIRFIYLIFAILIIYAIVRNIKNWPKIGWPVLIIVYFNLIFSNLHAIARYSLPIYPFYIIFLALGVLIIWDKLIKEKSR